MNHIRIESADSGTPPVQGGGSGAIPTSMLFSKHDWWVSTVSLPKVREIIERWHYARGGSNTAVYRHGLLPRGWVDESQCVGAAWWIPPTKSAALALDPNWQGVLSLSRLAISPDVPNNAESFLIRHSMRQIDRNRWPILVTYADEWQGHRGTIYEASGWTFHGKTKPERRYTLNGRMIARKAGPRTRTHAEMLDLGAVCIGSFSALRFVHRVLTTAP